MAAWRVCSVCVHTGCVLYTITLVVGVAVVRILVVGNGRIEIMNTQLKNRRGFYL
jgi:hypothetical protein